MMAFAVVLKCHTYEYRCQHCKYESLNESNQYLDAADEQCKRNSDSCTEARACHTSTGFTENEYQTDQTQYNDVTRCHVCEETYHESNRLSEHSYHLDDSKKYFQLFFIF